MRPALLPGLLLCWACAVPLAACGGRSIRAGDPARAKAHSFVTDDVVRFVSAFAALPHVSDSAALLDSSYLAKGSAGLRAYAARYPLSAKGLAAAIARYPADYAGIGARLQWLETQFDSLGRVLDKYRTVYPGMIDLPVYFLVGEHAGVNSGSEAGPLHTIENGAARPARTNLSELLAHEVTHIQQFSAVGLERYRSLYSTRPSLLGVIVREGIAEFMAELLVGRVTQRRAQDYFTNQESAIWREFRAQLCATSAGEWAGRRPSDPDRPTYLGYALGAAIARSYYANMHDKEAALRTLLSSDDYERILVESGYIEKQGEERASVRSLLARCGQ